MTVSLVVVSHSGKIADGAAELAAQMAPDVVVLTAGGTSDGRIGTSLEKVLAALDKAGSGGTVILTDLGSAVMTAESALEFAENAEDMVLADAPLVEGLVAAAVAAQGGADMQAVKRAAEAAGGPVRDQEQPPLSSVEEGRVTGGGPDFTGDFELVNLAGMHARPAAKIAGGLSAMDAEVTVNGVDGASMTGLMTLAAGKGSVLHVEAWGADAERAVNYVGGLVQAGFGEP
ncbi:dihydroxyacetone kinase phosphoryl donor subunit DhaM [Pseudarthrobacter sp. CC4]|uniref:dihydroxyacetone kinase phosphoryl donor subunit DhaM n=1 Tax=unclassified Pseudarthrobacter TaxID=2647000 RepID=UPI0012FB7769|nr:MULTISPECIES: dihydroxyacetone kinase phosphoryl donor subunit DhaM [unclassified Pseudarthrobacter]MEA3551990.1 dihydroxyacetone kinase phosphoryl donor subunit DhaM [Pseudarthrobacter sp. C1]MUU71233.1 PTS-dependent dihydroxyacetone kinase phosphotransferase subunit DhaM [Pseudarthrobacter sp. GA104]HET7781133.1 dihydroxyacetone kinase phosphoryl donor subunit DhaM [Arthrobacter sp.]